MRQGIPYTVIGGYQIPPTVLLGAHSAKSDPRDGCDEDHADAVYADDHEHAVLYETRSIVRREPSAEVELRSLVAALPPDVLRVKGFVSLAEDSEHRYLLQLVGRRWTLTAGEAWRDDKPETRLVLIGLSGSLAAINSNLSDANSHQDEPRSQASKNHPR